MKKNSVLNIVQAIANDNKNIAIFYFAEFRYVPRALSHLGRLKIHPLSLEPKENIQNAIFGLRIKYPWQLGIISRVKLKNGEYKHIPQIDFDCKKSKQNILLIKKCLQKIIKIDKGFLIDSGNSYHFYGKKLLTQEQWLDFLGRCLLCNQKGGGQIIDTRWIGYSLMLGYTTLRILESPFKSKPVVLRKL